MNRLSFSSAVCAAALVLLAGCSSDSPTAAGTPAPPASSAPPSSAPADGPSASASAAANGAGAALCVKVNEAKAALNEELKGVVSADGTVPPAAGKKVMTDLAAKLKALADAGDGELGKALDALAAEASKAAKAADPVRSAMGTSFDAAGKKVDSVCTSL